MVLYNRVLRVFKRRFGNVLRKTAFLSLVPILKFIRSKQLRPMLLDEDGLWFSTGYNFWINYDFKSRMLELEKNAFWEKVESELILKNLKPNDVFLDIGANIGYFSLLAANAGARVVAFEPTPYTYSTLVRNIAKNGCEKQVRTINKAIGDVSGSVSFVTNLGSKNHVAHNSTPDFLDIPMTTLDLFCGSMESHIDFIKVDIEGYEYHFLKGAVNALKKYRPMVLMEVEQHRLEPFNFSAEDVFEFFNEMGYQYCAVNHEGIHQSTNVLDDIQRARNFLFYLTEHKICK